MSDEDIKKALKYCFNGECEFCPYRGDKFFCFDKVKEEALDLINRQQAEIERLNSLYVSLGTDSLGNDVDVKLKYIYELETKLEAFKSEAIKEFAERLKKEAVTKCDWDNCVDIEDIDRLVAEMVGEQNA